jgi:hypothetical protein
LSCGDYPAASAKDHFQPVVDDFLGCLVKLLGANVCHSTFAGTVSNALVLEAKVVFFPFFLGSCDFILGHPMVFALSDSLLKSKKSAKVFPLGIFHSVTGLGF